MSLTHPSTAQHANRIGPLRVAVLGKGAIGGPVARALANGDIPGAVLAAVADSHGAVDAQGAEIGIDELANHADLLVEAAGQDVLVAFGPRVITAGIDLLVLSLGALADPDLHDALNAGPGRLYLSTGAIGGLDLLKAVASSRGLKQVTIETTKLPGTLVQGWMDDDQRSELLAATTRVEVLRGSPAQIATAFPKSANVAMAVAIAAGDADLVEAVVYADPDCRVTTHEIGVESSTGSYRFRIRSEPSPDNPATSGLVPFAVLRALRDLAGCSETLI